MRLGIDFGTTNSSVAYFDGATLHRLDLDLASDNPNVLPSLIYLNREQHTAVGTSAAIEYLQHETGRAVSWAKRRVGEIDVVAAGVSYVQTVHVLVDTAAHGRLLQSIKTALRDPSYTGTQVFERFYTVDELIAIILRALKARAEETFGEPSASVVIGRPVEFSTNPAVSARAEEILFKAARLAGFTDIRFALEPIGATTFYHRSTPQRQTAFVFDFGGGTLDLTVAHVGGTRAPEILATRGVLVGGDDLDRRLMQTLRKYFGGAALPGHMLELLDNWQTMPLLSRPVYLKQIDELRRANPKAAAALRTLVTRNLGFKLFQAIERAKKTLSTQHFTALDFVYDAIQIREPWTRRQFESLIANEIAQVETGIRQTLADARVTATDIDIVLRTGGSSAVPAFATLLENIFGEEKLAEMDLLTSVVGGLAMIAQDGGGINPAYRVRYPPPETPLIENVHATSGKRYETYPLRIGEKCYADSVYTLTRIPVELAGLPAIRPAQADKQVLGAACVQFDLARAAMLYLAYDPTNPQIPSWLKNFAPSELQIQIDQWGAPRVLQIVTKQFAAGRVSLGGNGAPKRDQVFLHYLVIAQAIA